MSHFEYFLEFIEFIEFRTSIFRFLRMCIEEKETSLDDIVLSSYRREKSIFKFQPSHLQ